MMPEAKPDDAEGQTAFLAASKRNENKSLDGLETLLKNSTNAAVLKGHGFIRANKLHKVSRGFNP
jgi:hypothetical protein